MGVGFVVVVVVAVVVVSVVVATAAPATAPPSVFPGRIGIDLMGEAFNAAANLRPNSSGGAAFFCFFFRGFFTLTGWASAGASSGWPVWSGYGSWVCWGWSWDKGAGGWVAKDCI